MNVYNEFLAKSSIQTFFGKNHPYIFPKYKKYLEDNLSNTFDKNFPTEIKESGNLKSNAIYFSFHFGPFLFIPYYLIKEKKHNIKFIISESSSGDRIDYFLKFAEKDSFPLTVDNFIIADAPNGVKKILSAIKNGETIFVLIDIMVGTTPIDIGKNIVPVKLLNGNIRMRSAILNIAYKLKYPVFQSFACWNGRVREISFKEIEYNDSNYEDLLQQIWDNFGELLSKHPSQWESYHTIYKFLSPAYLDTNNLDLLSELLYKFDESSIQIFHEKDYTYIGSFSTSKIFSASQKLISVIDYCIKEEVSFRISELLELFDNKDIVLELITHKIIIKHDV